MGIKVNILLQNSKAKSFKKFHNFKLTKKVEEGRIILGDIMKTKDKKIIKILVVSIIILAGIIAYKYLTTSQYYSKNANIKDVTSSTANANEFTSSTVNANEFRSSTANINEFKKNRYRFNCQKQCRAK